MVESWNTWAFGCRGIRPRRMHVRRLWGGRTRMRRRQLKWLWQRLKKLSTMTLTRDALLMTLGAAPV